MGNFVYFPGVDHTTNGNKKERQLRSIAKSSLTHNKHQQRRIHIQSHKQINKTVTNIHHITKYGSDDVTNKTIPVVEKNNCDKKQNESDNIGIESKTNHVEPISIISEINDSNINNDSEEDSILNNSDEGTNYYFSSTDNDENDESHTTHSISSYIAPAATTKNTSSKQSASSVTKVVHIYDTVKINNATSISEHKNNEPAAANDIHVLPIKRKHKEPTIECKQSLSQKIVALETNKIKQEINDTISKPNNQNIERKMMTLKNDNPNQSKFNSIESLSKCSNDENMSNDCCGMAINNDENMAINNDSEEGTNYYFSSSNDSDSDSLMSLCIAPAAITVSKINMKKL